MSRDLRVHFDNLHQSFATSPQKHCVPQICKHKNYYQSIAHNQQLDFQNHPLLQIQTTHYY